jgi:hypothetical protein
MSRLAGFGGSARALRAGLAGVIALGTTAAMVTFGVIGELPSASAAQAPVGLGTAKSFAVLAGTTVTNTGPSTISGDLGVSPGTAVTGFPPGKVIHGTQHRADGVAGQAQSDLTTAYNDAAGRTPVVNVSGDLGGRTLDPGVYKNATGLGLTGTVILDAHGDAGAVFVFQAGSTLITSSSSTVKLEGGAQACNVFWQVGSSATLGTNSTFVGNILALTSASVETGTSVAGRVLARTGAVTLDDNTITVPSCSTTGTTTTTVGGSTTSTTSGGGSTTSTTSGGGSTTSTTSPGGSTTTTTSAGGSTTTTATPTPVPGTSTGEPWAGWLYWVLAALMGMAGLASMSSAVRLRRRQQ